MSAHKLNQQAAELNGLGAAVRSARSITGIDNPNAWLTYDTKGSLVRAGDNRGTACAFAQPFADAAQMPAYVIQPGTATRGSITIEIAPAEYRLSVRG